MKNTLPDLPNKHDQLEAKFGLKLKEWFTKNPRPTCTIETKDTRGKPSLPFSEVKEAQIRFGQRVKSDQGIFVRLYPFIEGTPDYAWFWRSPAYIVIKYPKQFSLIDVDTFLMENNRSKVRSLSASRAEDISILTVKL